MALVVSEVGLRERGLQCCLFMASLTSTPFSFCFDKIGVFMANSSSLL